MQSRSVVRRKLVLIYQGLPRVGMKEHCVNSRVNVNTMSVHVLSYYGEKVHPRLPRQIRKTNRNIGRVHLIHFMIRVVFAQFIGQSQSEIISWNNTQGRSRVAAHIIVAVQSCIHLKCTINWKTVWFHNKFSGPSTGSCATRRHDGGVTNSCSRCNIGSKESLQHIKSKTIHISKFMFVFQLKLYNIWKKKRKIKMQERPVNFLQNPEPGTRNVKPSKDVIV